VDDLLNGILALMAMPKARLDAFFVPRRFAIPVVNIGNPGEFTIRELAEKTLALIPESRSKIIFKPLPPDDPQRRKPDIAWATELLGWKPEVDLDAGLRRTIDYFRTVGCSR
jgi:UDP-glucuronate decarboxylase